MHIHFIGIGGIGMSALAQFHRARGWRISGSDLKRSEITDALRRQGIRVAIGQRKANVTPDTTRVVYTVAVPPKNPELREAKRRNIKTQTYAEAVGELTRKYRLIAVAGAHGKSTTTGMLAAVFRAARRDPTVIVGTKLRELGGSNFRVGTSPYFLLEADEYRASFWNYRPTVAVVLNIDREHLDFYHSIQKIKAAYLRFLRNITPGGTAVLNRDDPRVGRVGARLKRMRPDIRVIWFSLRDSSAKQITKVIKIPGAHNRSNALAAYAAAKTLGITPHIILVGISRYRGAWRRFQRLGTFREAKLYADYAHHPTEVRATIAGAREQYPRHRIIVVFQPHHYERMRTLFPEFTRAFDGCNQLYLLDIYEVAGREAGHHGPNVKALAAAIRKRGHPAEYVPPSANLGSFLKSRLKQNDVLIMMGAGSIWEMTKALLPGRKPTFVPRTFDRAQSRAAGRGKDK